MHDGRIFHEAASAATSQNRARLVRARHGPAASHSCGRVAAVHDGWHVWVPPPWRRKRRQQAPKKVGTFRARRGAHPELSPEVNRLARFARGTACACKLGPSSSSRAKHTRVWSCCRRAWWRCMRGRRLPTPQARRRAPKPGSFRAQRGARQELSLSSSSHAKDALMWPSCSRA